MSSEVPNDGESADDLTPDSEDQDVLDQLEQILSEEEGGINVGDDVAEGFDALDAAAAAGAVAGAGAATADLSVEDLVAGLEKVTAERDEYLDRAMRNQAEFENYRKAVVKREIEAKERANEGLIKEILPVLDACDGAISNGADDVKPIHKALVESLTKQGLERLDPQGAAFNPDAHEAVMHEPAEDGDDQGPVVAEVLRAGYSWKGRVVRPAMVRVRG